MRKLSLSLALLCALLTSGTLSAQYFGLRVGVNATNANIDFDNAEVDTDGETNLMLGAFADFPLGTNLISIQPEINYLNRGYSFEADIDDLIDTDYSVAYLDLGALVKLNFNRDNPLGFYVGVGPYLSYAVSGQITEVGEDERDIDFDADRLNRGDIQVAGVAGVTFGAGLKFFVEGRYLGSLSSISDDDDLDISQRALGVSGGVMVPLGN